MATQRATAQAVENPLAFRFARELRAWLADRTADEEVLDRTPYRVLDALAEMTQGYHQDPDAILRECLISSPFEDLVILKDIEFTSLCAHHLMPFGGRAHVGYIPEGHIVGLSKLARLVDCCAQRLQIQEQLCADVAGAISRVLSKAGAACVIEANHGCLSCRGARKPRATFITSSMQGLFRSDASLRHEFMTAIGLTGSAV